MSHPAARTTSQAILAFFTKRHVRVKHNALELIDRYTPDMEVQVMVAADGGEPVPGRRNTWTDADGSETWHNVRIPRNAKSVPERNDWLLKYDLSKHVEAIGMTGHDFGTLCSRWFGFDFDAIVGHAAGVGISDAELEAVKAAAWKIPWLEIRKSTGGSGLHVYALCCKEGIPTANHTEHAALGRAILEKLSAETGFDFSAKVDACGGNMWVWHRKSSLENEGLKLLKPATARLSAADIPGDWRSHLSVIQKKRATQRVIGVPDSADDEFDQLVSARTRVPLNAEHRRIIQAMSGNGFSAIYQRDNHLFQVHTARLHQLMSDPAMQIKGIFKTLSAGTDPGQPNAFMFPLSNGGFRAYRFSPGTKEADTWEQGDGWTFCDFNVRSTLDIAAKAVGGYEMPDGSYLFDTALQGLAALKGMGAEVTLPEWCGARELTIKRNTKPRKLTVLLQYNDGDDNDHSKVDLRKHRWNLTGQRTKGWSQVVTLPSSDSADLASDLLDRCDGLIRSLVSMDGKDAGWRLCDSRKIWVDRDRTAAKDRLADIGIPKTQIDGIIAKLQSRNWSLRNMPFQPEFPGGRVWNIGAELAFAPTDDDRSMVHPHWDSILAHVGQGLDRAVQDDEWCQQNGIVTGADYLLHWSASLFQQPSQKLPYLFFYGEQETGKSSFKNALGLLMSRGNIEARNALLSQHNGELDGAILAFIEEVNLSGKGSDAYNRIKDWVTADEISINAKYVTVYKSPSHLHWIQVANDRRFCPVFEDDTRIVMIHVRSKPAQEIAWPELREKLKAEAPDFLRTLLDTRLPYSKKRLWLPVLDTEAKLESIFEKENAQGIQFNPKPLERALRRVLLQDGTNLCKGIITDLIKKLGPGPWSQDPNVFGRQIKLALKDAHQRGLKASSKRTKDGMEWSIQEHWDETNIDPEEELTQLALLAEYAMEMAAREADVPPSVVEPPHALPAFVHTAGAFAPMVPSRSRA